MIVRIWKGTTTDANARKYEQLLKEVVFPGIKNKNVSGYQGIQLLKEAKDNVVHFITIIRFEDIDAVKEFAGENYEKSYVIDEAKALLKFYDAKAAHYELLHDSITM